jgi:hypothetical protein
MTNPLAIIALHAADTYHNALISAAASAAASTQNKLPKSLLYALGTTILATVIYKSLHKYTNITKSPRLCNFLYTISLPLNYMCYKLIWKKNQNNQSSNTPTQEVAFEEKYFKEYDEWIAQHDATDATDATAAVNKVIDPVEEEHKKECLENMYYSTVRERINDFYGDVIMCYDHATFSFAYYARTGNIPYKYLETISRKYMIETNAPREIHVDIRDEYKKAKERTTQSTQAVTSASASASASASTDTDTPQTTPPPQKEDADVFVKLKSYNTASNLNLHTTTNDTKEKTHKFVNEKYSSASAASATATSASAAAAAAAAATTDTETATTNKVIRERANRYSYRGKIDDFAEHHKTYLADRRKAAAAAAAAAVKAASTATATTVDSYAEFKKQMMKTRSAL